MQDLLSRLDPMIAIILIVAGVLALVIVVILTRRLRRRQTSTDDLGASPGLTGQVDYTALPLDDEPSDWRDRFANLSLASKILVILVPILAILGVLVLVLTLLPGGSQPQAPVALATAEPVSLKVTKADVVRVNPEITVSVSAEATGLDGVKVTVELVSDGKPVAYLRPEDLEGVVVRRGRVEVEAHKQPGAAALQQGAAYSIRVSTADGHVSGEIPLTVLKQFEAALFGRASAVAPTPTATAAQPSPTTPPTVTPAADVTPAPTGTPAPALPSGPEAVIG
ncbi:MAG: SH3 domain-containing protein, partial [Chloroflexales bacterium]